MWATDTTFLLTVGGSWGAELSNSWFITCGTRCGQFSESNPIWATFTKVTYTPSLRYAGRYDLSSSQQLCFADTTVGTQPVQSLLVWTYAPIGQAHYVGLTETFTGAVITGVAHVNILGTCYGNQDVYFQLIRQ